MVQFLQVVKEGDWMYAFDLEVKLDQLLVKVGEKIKLKEFSSVMGLVISFGLAVGRLARRKAEFQFSFSLVSISKQRNLLRQANDCT